ncbi:MAG: hypothetical protein WD049_07975 [Candidatus Paceibacterota bacterium]
MPATIDVAEEERQLVTVEPEWTSQRSRCGWKRERTYPLGTRKNQEAAGTADMEADQLKGSRMKDEGKETS